MRSCKVFAGDGGVAREQMIVCRPYQAGYALVVGRKGICDRSQHPGP